MTVLPRFSPLSKLLPRSSRMLATFGSCIALTAMVAPTLASAQQYPTRPVRLVVPYAPSGGIQVAARLLGEKLTEMWGQSVIIENRPGAGANLGTDMVAKSAPDGYTFVIVSSTVAIAASITPKPNYDVLKDLTPVVLLSNAPFVLAVSPKLGVSNVKAMLDVARTKPGGLNFASAGQGTSTHLAIELLKARTGIPAVHVPYKGSALAMGDLLEGRVDAMFATPAGIMPHVKAKRLGGLAVTGSMHTPSAPGLPTMKEAGVPNYDVSVWFGILAPAGTPPAIVQKFYNDSAKILAMPDVIEKLNAQGQDVTPMGPEKFGETLRADVKTWAEVIQKSNLKFE